MGSKNSLISKLARNLDATGDITADAIATTVSLGAKIYASRANLPSSGNTAGDQAYVTDSNRLYIWNGSGWYNIALLNVAPSIQSVLDSDGGTTPFSLANDGTPTRITITAADSDGDPITYAASANSGFNGLATLSQADNVFTITPFSRDSATTTSGTITFTATDGINVASSGIQTFTLNFLSPYWDETLVSIGTSSTNTLANSTFIDRSANALTVTPTGTPIQTAFHPYLDNWSIYLDGNGEYLTLGSGISNFGTDDFTIEGWVKFPTGSTNGFALLDNRPSNTQGAYITTYIGPTTISWYTNNAERMSAGSMSLAYETWHHFAICRTSGTTTYYVNGSVIDTYTDSVNYLDNTNRIGGNAYIGENTDAVYFSNYRIVKGTAVYTSAFTPPTEKLTAISGTSLLIGGSNRFIDTSGNNNTITLINTPEISSSNPFGQGSEYASGENKGSYKNITLGTDSIYINPHTSKVLVYNEDWTIDFWCYADTFTVEGTILSKGVLTARQWGVAVKDSELKFYYSTNGSSSGDTTKAISYDFIAKQWYHIAYVNDGATNTLTYYVNGTSIGTQVLGVYFTSNTYGETVGRFMDYTAASHAFDGYISDLRIDNGNKVYTSNFTPPTSPVGNTNTDLYLPMDNVGIFDKTGNNTLTLNGNVATSTTQTKYADTAVYFDGTGDYILAGPNELYSNDFTIELWWYPTSTARQALMHGSWGNDWSIGIDYSSTSSNQKIGIWASSNGSSWNLINSDGGGNGIGSETINQNAWNHIAYTRSGTTWRLFVNGVLDVELTGISGSIARPTQQIAIGAWWSTGSLSQVNGYIENFQILKGVAKYTTNFTPPTKTQGRNYQAES